MIFAPGRGDDDAAREASRAGRCRAPSGSRSLGENLYEASPLSSAQASQGAPRRQFFTRGEVILSGGSFNTPQLLMLSGIGDPAHLATHGIDGLRDRDGKRIVAEVVALPGVGRNLQDRYEVSVISQVKKASRS